MKISILGTNGFLSNAIAKYCNKQGYHLNMYGLDEPKEHHFDKYFPIDLIHEKLDYSVLNKSDIIIYCIGAGIQSNLKESSSLIYDLNVNAPVKICNNLKYNNYKGVFVSFGSFFEIGETEKREPFVEEDVLNSMSSVPNDYTVSKRMFSKFVSSYEREFTHWHYYLPTIYGNGENPLRLIPYTIDSIKKNASIHITSGEQIRQYLYVGEVPQVIDLSYKNKLQGGLFNIEGPDTISVKQLVNKIYSYFGKETPKDCFGSETRVDVSMKYLSLNGSKLANFIGYKPTINISSQLDTY